MTKVLVVDDVAIIRDPIAASLRLAGFETFCAGDGEEALALTRFHRPDVILLDVSLPKMNGLAFLKILRSEPAIAHTRVILLTAVSEKIYVVAALKMGVKDYLLKSRFRLSDLIDRIKHLQVLPPANAVVAQPAATPASTTTAVSTHVAAPPAGLAPAPLAAVATKTDTIAPAVVQPGMTARQTVADDDIPRLLTREEFLDRLKKVFEFKSLSGVVAQVIALASSSRGEMTQMANLIAQDPMLSVRVLQAANSASYSTGVAVTAIPGAIRKLGFNTVRNLAAALGVFDCLPKEGVDGFDPVRYWQHSFAVAQLCERLATTIAPEQSGLAYVVGLCHDLGDIFIRTQFGKEYQQVVEYAARTGRPRDELHWLMLGMTTSQMVTEVLKSISLPDAIREPIEIIHSSNRTNTTNVLARLLWIAENLANAALIASTPRAEIEVLTQSECKTSLGTANPPPPDAATLRSQVLALTIYLAKLSPADETKLLVPMFATGSAKIWVARAPQVSSTDPVSLALTSLTKVTFEKRLPLLTELDGFDGLIVLSPSTSTVGFLSQDVEAIVAKAAQAGRKLSTLCIAASPSDAAHKALNDPWLGKISLAELASFIEALSKASETQAAA